MHLHVCCMLVAGYECIFIKYHPMPTIIRASSWCKGRIIWFCVHCTKCTEFYHREMRGVNRNQTKKTTTTTNICTTSRTVQHKRCHSILACDVDRSGQQWHYLANNNFITAYESMNAHTHTYHSVSDNLHGSQTIIPIIIILPKHQSQRIKIKKPSSSVKFTSTWVWLGFNIHISRWEARNMLW